MRATQETAKFGNAGITDSGLYHSFIWIALTHAAELVDIDRATSNPIPDLFEKHSTGRAQFDTYCQ